MSTVSFESFSGSKPVTPVGTSNPSTDGGVLADSSKKITADNLIKSTGLDYSGFGQGALQKTREAFSAGINKIKSSIMGGADKFNTSGDIFDANPKTAATNLFQKTGALLEASLGSASGAVQAIFAPLTGGIEQLVQHSSDNPDVQAFSMSKPVATLLDTITKSVKPIKDLAETHPEAAKNIVDGFNVALSVLGEKVPEIVKNTNMQTLDHASDIIYPTTPKGIDVPGTTAPDIGAAFTNIGKNMVSAGSKVTEAVRGKAIDLLSNIDEATKSALTKTPKSEFTNMVNIGKEAIKNDNVPHPLDVAGAQVEKGLPVIVNKLRDASQIKNDVLYKSGLSEKNVGPIVSDTVGTLKNTLSNIELDPKDVAFKDQFIKDLETLGDNPTLGAVDKKIDLLQERLYKNSGNLLLKSANKSNRLIGPLRQALGEINSKAKELGGSEYTSAIDRVAELTQLKNKLNKDLGPQTVGDESKGATNFLRRLFTTGNAKDARQTLQALQKETGVDYIRQARIAKFVMDSLGDIRSKSLLEASDVPLSAQGVTTKAAKKVIDYMIKKTGISDPLKAAERFIEQSKAKKAVKTPKEPTRSSDTTTSTNEPPAKPQTQSGQNKTTSKQKVVDLTALNDEIAKTERAQAAFKKDPEAYMKKYPNRDAAFFTDRLAKLKKRVQLAKDSGVPF